jgi:hypothetical protein
MSIAQCTENSEALIFQNKTKLDTIVKNYEDKFLDQSNKNSEKISGVIYDLEVLF